MGTPKQYYTFDGHNFIYKKSVKEVSSEFETVKTTEENFINTMICDAFEDSDAFIKNNPSFNLFETGDLPEEEIEAERIAPEQPNLLEMQILIKNLTSEIEILKNKKPEKKILSYEDEEKLVIEKGKLLKLIRIYTDRLTKFEELQEKKPQKFNEFDYERMSLKFNYEPNYTDKNYIATSNIFIIDAFIVFIIKELKLVIENSKKELQNIG